MNAKSPSIVSESWGRIVVEGHGEFKDVKLWPGGASAWNWNESRTSHDALDPADVDELIDHGAEVVILSEGRYGRLHVPQKVKKQIESRGVQVEVLRTDEALARYAELRETRPVGALIHSTC